MNMLRYIFGIMNYNEVTFNKIYKNNEKAS